MGISHDYHSTGRRRRGGPGGVIRFAGAVAGILLVSFAITAILEHGQAQPEELPTVTANGTAQNILAPLPMQGAADSTTDSAVSGGVTVRLCDEIGSMSSSVTNRISSAKPMAIISDRPMGPHME